MEVLQTRLTEPQLELLQMFAHPIDSTDWRNIKTLITEYFAKRAIEKSPAAKRTEIIRFHPICWQRDPRI